MILSKDEFALLQQIAKAKNNPDTNYLYRRQLELDFIKLATAGAVSFDGFQQTPDGDALMICTDQAPNSPAFEGTFSVPVSDRTTTETVHDYCNAQREKFTTAKFVENYGMSAEQFKGAAKP